MANLKSAIDCAFWDHSISTPHTLEGSTKSVPGEPFPLDGARASKALRIQQLSLLGNGFPLGIIPSICPPSHKDLGFLSLQSLLLRPSTSNWWIGLIGQFKPKKLISAIKTELQSADELELSVFRDAAKHFLDKSLYSIALATQLSLSPSTSLLWNTEWLEGKKGYRNKFKIYHQVPDHDITLDAAWPELFMDHKGKYWEVPESISLDMSSLPSDSGLQYRFGLHKNSGHPLAFNEPDGEAPSALMPGLCAKVAFSYQKSKDIWRRNETKEDLIVKTDKGSFWRPSYDVHLKEPHAAISGIIGGTCAAWFGKDSANVESQRGDTIPTSNNKRSPLNADLFGSACYTFQHGQFRKLYGDLTRVDARLDISSLSSFSKRIFKGSSNADKSLSSPRLNLIFQQQVAGPIVFRVDSKLFLDSKAGKQGPHIEDVIYSLCYSLRLLRSGKVVAWYSPKRKEGMIELRLFEF
ncbi:protein TRIGALACTOSYLDIACYLGLYCEROL 4, chloroplastic-like [Hibiscus syriacus]|uniref:protein TRIGALACTOSYLDIACYLGLYCEROL 4, chloroplastic-like n=1 Tax=Hibiscus syriacus TaxID=106335 RepID=UPI001921BA6E|nr:protein TRIGALACTOSYLDIACYLGLYCEROL 4, chloroplastic-like [Hibiscus syriacus]